CRDLHSEAWFRIYRIQVTLSSVNACASVRCNLSDTMAFRLEDLKLGVAECYPGLNQAHSECVDHLVNSLAPNTLQSIVRAEFTLNRQLDRGNAQPGSIGSDFGRLGVDFGKQ